MIKYYISSKICEVSSVKDSVIVPAFIPINILWLQVQRETCADCRSVCRPGRLAGMVGASLVTQKSVQRQSRGRHKHTNTAQYLPQSARAKCWVFWAKNELGEMSNHSWIFTPGQATGQSPVLEWQQDFLSAKIRSWYVRRKEVTVWGLVWREEMSMTDILKLSAILSLLIW